MMNQKERLISQLKDKLKNRQFWKKLLKDTGYEIKRALQEMLPCCLK